MRLSFQCPRIVVMILFAGVFMSLANSQDKGFFRVGEELTYEVSWSIFKIGTIRTKVIKSESSENNLRYTAVAYIDSYSGIPFVDLHVIFETIMDSLCFSNSFTAWEKKDKRWSVRQYDFDRQKGVVYLEKGISDSAYHTTLQNKRKKTLKIQEKILDGLSLLYFARANVKSSNPITIPTMIDSTQENTYLNFQNKRKSLKIDAYVFPIDVIELDGNTEFKGVFGLGGNFKGWFSNDEAKIPIRAKMNVILGTVNIELLRWNRNGWDPPRYFNR